jgi:RES domain
VHVPTPTYPETRYTAIQPVNLASKDERARLSASALKGFFQLDGRETSRRGWFAAIINAAFTYPHPLGSRFNSADRGAWYAAFQLSTAQAEVAFHKTVHLAEVGRCLACFDPKRVANVRRGARFRFSWRGKPAPEVIKVAAIRKVTKEK